MDFSLHTINLSDYPLHFVVAAIAGIIATAVIAINLTINAVKAKRNKRLDDARRNLS